MRVIGDIARLGAKRQADKKVVVQDESALTYRDLNSRTNRLAHALIASGVRPGDRVGILAENGLDYAVFVLAIAKTGAWTVPFNFRYSAGEIAYVVNDAGPKVVLVGPGLSEVFDAARGSFKTAPATIGFGGAAAADFEALLKAQPDTEPEVEVDASSPAMIMYTSGTTGFPKGVLFSHAAYLANHQVIALEGDLRRDDVVLICLPLFHNGGLNALLLPTLMSGATAVLTAKGFVPAAVLDAVARHRITVTMWVPTMLAMLVNHPDVERCDTSSLRKILYGSSPIAPPVLAATARCFAAGLYQFYGMTEIGMTSVLRPEDHATRAHCTGREMINADMRIVDEQGHDVPIGGVGEIISAAAPLGMIGYYGNPKATAETMREGWIRTGDVARVDGDGFFTVVDRKKDMIISGAENIYPKEIENVIVEHQAVLEVAVFGIPDDTYGEAVCAAVVTRPGQEADADDIVAFCAGRLARYKKPKRVVFVDALPKNAAGKVTKQVLRAPYWRDRQKKV